MLPPFLILPFEQQQVIIIKSNFKVIKSGRRSVDKQVERRSLHEQLCKNSNSQTGFPYLMRGIRDLKAN